MNFRPKVLLTIDDGPSASTLELLDTLECLNINAVFFCVGASLQRHFDEAVEIAKRGFLIGNHSWDHPHFSQISFQEAQTQILQTEAMIQKVYEAAGKVRPHKVFRFPYGDRGAGNTSFYKCFEWAYPRTYTLAKMLRALGFTSPSQLITTALNHPSFLDRGVDWFWSVDPKDWMWQDENQGPEENPTTFVEAMRSIPVQNFNPSRAEILLLHDQHRNKTMRVQVLAHLVTQVDFVDFLRVNSKG